VCKAGEEAIIWDMPLARVGFYVAQYARLNGMKVGKKNIDVKMLEVLKRKRKQWQKSKN